MSEKGAGVQMLTAIAVCLMVSLLLSPDRYPQATANAADRTRIFLYFADRTAPLLRSEPRELLLPSDPTAAAQLILKELADGPHRDTLVSPLEGLKLRGIYTTAEGVAYIDLQPENTAKLARGIRDELLTIFSMVNSLVLNIPQVQAVKLLVAGTEAETLAGHIDLSLPFEANILMMQ